MIAASSICRIRLSCSTTGPTSNWKALAITVLLRLVDFPNQAPLNSTGFQPTGNEGAAKGAAHGPLGEEAERCKRCRAGSALIWSKSKTEMSDLAEIEALFFALVGGSPRAEVVFLNENLAVGLGAVFRNFEAHFLGTLL